MTNENPTWTIMVYISADGVLANFAVESLKQLKAFFLGDDVGNEIVVVAQVDANGPIGASRYVFKKDGSDSSLDQASTQLGLPRGDGTADPKNLTDFVNWASDNYESERYGLFLWGHGVELLLDDDPPTESLLNDIDPKQHQPVAIKEIQERKPVRRYLTPSNLRKALAETKLAGSKRRLAFIGMDACSMSMVEIASVLEGYVDFMVASQEDVPDTSFPYGEILRRLRTISDPQAACEMVPKIYMDAYKDYVALPETGVRGITLSGLSLERISAVREALTGLSTILLNSISDPRACESILKARREAQGFVFGLFVDIVDFCQQLEATVPPRSDLQVACQKMRAAVKQALVANQAKMKGDHCHGLSIYFPYGMDDSTENLQEFRAKGSTNRPLKGSTNRPLKERAARIVELEDDFAVFDKFFDKSKGTRWDDFIKRGWSLILATNEPGQLDERYSAQRCAQNLGLIALDRKKSDTADDERSAA